jgi:hypothetical protein
MKISTNKDPEICYICDELNGTNPTIVSFTSQNYIKNYIRRPRCNYYQMPIAKYSYITLCHGRNLREFFHKNRITNLEKPPTEQKQENNGVN